MNPCDVDDSSSPTFHSQFSTFAKKHRKLKDDLAAAIETIGRDYKNACDAARVPNRNFKEPIKEVWKYSIKSTDLQRSPKNGFRAVGVFLDEQSTDGKPRTMYLALFYFKGDQADFGKDELERAVAFIHSKIKAAREQS